VPKILNLMYNKKSNINCPHNCKNIYTTYVKVGNIHLACIKPKKRKRKKCKKIKLWLLR